MIFTINEKNEINLLDAMPASDAPMPEGTVLITSSKDLTNITRGWPGKRLVEIWNNLAPRVDLKPVRKFENWPKAVIRIWRATEAMANNTKGKQLAAQLNAGNHDYNVKIEAVDGRRKKADGAEPALRLDTTIGTFVNATSDLAACPAPAKKGGKKTKAAKAPKASKPARAAKPAAGGEPKAPREGTAKAKVIEMISRKGGATLEEICEATGWQKHTTRGFISTLHKKGGPEVVSTRRE